MASKNDSQRRSCSDAGAVEQRRQLARDAVGCGVRGSRRRFGDRERFEPREIAEISLLAQRAVERADFRRVDAKT